MAAHLRLPLFVSTIISPVFFCEHLFALGQRSSLSSPNPLPTPGCGQPLVWSLCHHPCLNLWPTSFLAAADERLPGFGDNIYSIRTLQRRDLAVDGKAAAKSADETGKREKGKNRAAGCLRLWGFSHSRC